MNPGRIEYARHEDVIVLKFSGDIRIGHVYDATAALDIFLDKLFEKQGFGQIVVDLREAEQIDSTNLGLLAKIARFSNESLEKPATLVSTQPDINTVLLSVGFDQVFQIVDSADGGSGAFEEIKGDRDGDMDFTALILEAHRALASLNEKNAEMFRDFIEVFEEELRD